MSSPSSTAARIGLVVAACTALVLGFTTACSSDKGTENGQAPPKMEPLAALGNGEGQLNLIAWAGYAEDGSNDPKVDWVTPFEKQTGCQVNVKIGNTSDEMVQLMRSGQYDGVSASGDATLRLIYAGDVAPVNTSLVPNYESISSFLKDKSWNSVDGQMYGVPHGWGANLLMYNIQTVTDAPNSWSAVFDDASKYKGKVTAYDSPIYIADAALYLSKTKPELGIKDPYSLTPEQLDAATDLLKKQRENVSEYWSDYTKEVQAFESGTSVIGTTWQVIANTIGTDNKVQVNTVLPKEGSTGWSDTWMVSAKAAHPNCMYKWMDWITSPEVNAQVAEYFGEAPAQTKACERHREKDFCDIYHATDEEYAEQIHYWTTPQRHASMAVATTARPTTSGSTSGSRSRGEQARRPAIAVSAESPRLALLLPPMAWLVIAYLGSLAVLLVSAFWTHRIVHRRSGAHVHQRQHRAGAHRCGVPRGDAADHRRGAGGHGDLQRARGAVGLLHGQGRPPRVAAGVGGGGDDAAVGELSGQGLRLADAVLAGGADGLADRATRRGTG